MDPEPRTSVRRQTRPLAIASSPRARRCAAATLALAITLGLAAGASAHGPAVGAQRIAIEAPSKESRFPRPGRGMTMSEVEQRYGAPHARHGAVGDPPISRWTYAKFTVYFEHDRVIHSVANRVRH